MPPASVPGGVPSNSTAPALSDGAGGSALTLRGIIPAILTPFDEHEKVDLPAFARLLDRTIGAGVHGIFVAGTQGEFYALDHAEYREIVEFAASYVGDRVPVLAGVSAPSTPHALAYARAAEEAGVDSIVSLAPFFPVPTPGQVLAHFQALAATTDLPLFIYHHPKNTHAPIGVELATRIADLASVVGIKDSGGDLALTLELRRSLPKDVAVFVGHDSLIAYALMGGADGAVAATANVTPKLVVAIWNAVREERYERAVALQHALSSLRESFKLGAGAVVLKEALSIAGLGVGACRPSSVPLTHSSRVLLADVVRPLLDIEALLDEDLGQRGAAR